MYICFIKLKNMKKEKHAALEALVNALDIQLKYDEQGNHYEVISDISHYKWKVLFEICKQNGFMILWTGYKLIIH